MNEDLNSLWTLVSDKFNIGNFEEFSAKMGTIEERKSFWDTMVEEDIDLGNYEEYEGRLGKSTDPASDTDSGSDDGSSESVKVIEGKGMFAGQTELPIGFGGLAKKTPTTSEVIDGIFKVKDSVKKTDEKVTSRAAEKYFDL